MASLLLELSHFDMLRNPLLQRELPGLMAAFDTEAIREHLQAALFGDTQDRYLIEGCAPGKATYLAERGCILRYQLDVRDKESGELLRPLVNARVFPSQAAGKLYLRERLAPLAARMQGRPEIAPFITPVAILEPFNLAVSIFPIDGELPTLVGATDRHRMVEIFRETPAALADGFVIEGCRVEVGHYGRQHRCVLHYHLEGKPQNSSKIEHRLVYGKVANDERGALASLAINLLRERIVKNNNGHPFNIPQAFGFWPDLRLALLEAIPGQARIGQLLEARFNDQAGPEPEPLTLEEAVGFTARIAAALHTSGLTLGHRRTLADELAKLRQESLAIRPVAPELWIQLQAASEQIVAQAETSEAMKLCFSHGDFTHSQLIFEGATAGLVDFDTICQAEPALDLGHFLAYLRLAARKAQGSEVVSPAELSESLCTHFLNCYIETAGAGLDEEQLCRRVSIYEIISLWRMALHSWQKLKSSRLEQVIAILEERIQCLPQLSY